MALTPRGLARILSGLALAVAMLLGGCSSQDEADGIAKLASRSAIHEPTPTADGTTEAAEPSESAEETTTSPADAGAPAAADASGNYTLRIPAIGISVPVIPVQSNADRVLLPPDDPSVGGWWSQGAAPGATQGSAVIVGHSVRTGAGPFNAIGDLRTGDTIDVVGSSEPLTYRVESIDVLTKDELARDAEQIFDQSVSGRLVLITCEDWDGQTWQSNVVAIATPA